jgi:membrane protein DedA with SNARE-associated domain
VIEWLASIKIFLPNNMLWVAEAITLIVLPFAHEDIAIILGGYAIVKGSLPTFLVFGSLYTGIVASDITLYGIGLGARYVPRLNSLVENRHVKELGKTLNFNIITTVVFCRVVPGTVFVAFVYFGLTRTSFGRFIASSLLVSALYLTLMLYLVIWFDNVFEYYFGLLTWPILTLIFVMSGLGRKFLFGDKGETNSPPQK